MKKIIIAGMFFVIALNQTVQAKEPVYPVASLGNCRDRKECFYYCQIPEHQEACQAYGDTLKEEQVLGETTSTGLLNGVAFPIAELGNCVSASACRAFCSQTQHKSVCLAFEQANLRQIVTTAKTALGCDYATTCKTFCNQQENRQKCEDFFKTYGQHIPVPSEKPISEKLSVVSSELMSIDCANPANAAKCGYVGIMCGNYCQKNPTLCRPGNLPVPSDRPEPSKRPGSGVTNNAVLEKLTQITGCATPQECSTYCQSHMDQCKGIINSIYPSHAPVSP